MRTSHPASRRSPFWHLSVTEHLDFSERSKEIERSIDTNPRYALSLYEGGIREATTILVRKSIRYVYQPRMWWVRRGSMIANGRDALPALADLYRRARRIDRRILVTSIVDTLRDLGRAAEQDAGAASTLRELGSSLGTFVLTGTVAQQLTCKIAIYIGLAPAVPQRLSRFTAPMIRALAVVLEAGAPATRDIAVEAIGALLKTFPKRRERTLRRSAPRASDGDNAAVPEYNEQLVRHRRMVLAVSGDSLSRDELFSHVDAKATSYEARADLLRTLPAILRQSPSETRCIAALAKAAKQASVDRSSVPHVAAEFARHQRSVFRTVEVMLQRRVPASEFDDAVANAVDEVPETIAGEAPLCNGIVRATVTILTTAATLVARAAGSKTENYLDGLFRNVRRYARSWGNPGIVEGCYRSLPLLLPLQRCNAWTRPALVALLKDMTRVVSDGDLPGMHRKLFAAASFRAILIALAERMHESNAGLPQPSARSSHTVIEHALRTLLADPSADAIISLFQTPYASHGGRPRAIHANVLAAAAFETEILSRSASLLASWKDATPSGRLLLTRILSVQMHALSHDAREIARYPVLKKLYDAMPAVTLSEDVRQKIIWRCISSIDADVAFAAGADLQDFIEYRSGRATGEGNGDVGTLPDHVLTMISKEMSDRFAGAIAREIHLNLLRARRVHQKFDLAIFLYQVTLRGPHWNIFDRLMPRMLRSADRDLVGLFRLHVKSIEDCRPEVFDALWISNVVQHACSFVGDLAKRKSLKSPVLADLEVALRLYTTLASSKSSVWQAVRGHDECGGLADLFQALDRLRRVTHSDPKQEKESAADAERKRSLFDRTQEDCRQLRTQVSHYMALPVGQFEERKNAMRKAIAAVDEIKRKLEPVPTLQPPQRVMLDALLHHCRDLFRRTEEVYIDAPRRCVDTYAPDDFWESFVAPKRTDAPAGGGRWPIVRLWLRLRARVRNWESGVRRFFGGPAPAAGPAATQREDPPPPLERQADSFERFFVEWMSSELDIHQLDQKLRRRWNVAFRSAYLVMTQPVLTFLLIAFPCVVAILLDRRDTEWAHRLEGIGFFAYVSLLFGIAILSLVWPALKWLVLKLLRRQARPRQKRYMFEALLPRLLKLIIVPLAVLIDFDHSYELPMEASNVVLSVIMIAALVTTRFFVLREVVGHPHDRESSSAADRRKLRRQVRQIVAIALAHSFGVALLFSTIFGAYFYDHKQRQHEDLKNAISGPLALIFNRLPVSSEPRLRVPTSGRHEDGKRQFELVHKYHHKAFYVGYLPRETRCDVGTFLRTIPWFSRFAFVKEWEAHLHFKFYPTLILTWTAMGLFFGVFLDGFLKGERLRGEITR